MILFSSEILYRFAEQFGILGFLGLSYLWNKAEDIYILMYKATHKAVSFYGLLIMSLQRLADVHQIFVRKVNGSFISSGSRAWKYSLS